MYRLVDDMSPKNHKQKVIIIGTLQLKQLFAFIDPVLTHPRTTLQTSNFYSALSLSPNFPTINLSVFIDCLSFLFESSPPPSPSPNPTTESLDQGESNSPRPSQPPQEQQERTLDSSLPIKAAKVFIQSWFGRGPRVIVMIAGGAGSGKTTTAFSLANRMGIPNVIGTDQLRNALRSHSSPSLCPLLFRSTYELGTQNDVEKLVEGYEQQGELLYPAIRHTICSSDKSIILEGVGLTPKVIKKLISELRQEKKNIHCFPFIISVPESEHRKRLMIRGSPPSSRGETTPCQNKYVQHFENIKTISDYITRERNEEFPLITETNDGSFPMHIHILRQLTLST